MKTFGKIWAALFLLILPFHQSVQAVPRNPDEPVRMIVKSSPDSALLSELKFYSRPVFNAIANGASRKANGYPISDTYIEINNKMYVLDPSNNLYDIVRSETVYPTADVKRLLQDYASDLKSAHYGKMMTWRDAKRSIPLKSVISVTDLETGLQFQVQRRAGSTHADVQPLTRRDTEIMKRIYDGKWSWKRRAVIVSKDGQAIAGSMHGMPHGGDGIPGNGFSGHFCIHFLGSRTHGSGNVDPDHQIMVYKAAGRLPFYVRESDPNRIVEIFFIAINQKDPELMSALFPSRDHEQVETMRREIQRIKAIRLLNELEGYEVPPDDMLATDITAEALIYRNGSKETKRLLFQLRRSAVWESWSVDRLEMK
ncbi:hypothetical protein AB6A23_12425 [Paenibacillus tarimensis]